MNHVSAFRLVIGCLICGCLLSGCDKPQNYVEPQFSDKPAGEKLVYRFGIHPLHNPTHLHAVFDPVMDILNEQIPGVIFKVEASRNYAAYDKKLFHREFHFSLPNPYQTVEALKHGYRVFGKMADDHEFRGIILVRKDSGIKKVTDLKGAAVSYPAPTALAATMMPQYYLHTHGLNVLKDIENRYVGSQESSIMNVFLGETRAGATWPPPWKALIKQRPEVGRALEVKWETDPLPNNGLVVRDDVPEKIVTSVAEVILNLHLHERGRSILQKMELSRFEKADDTTYQPVRDFLERFVQQVRSPEIIK